MEYSPRLVHEEGKEVLLLLKALYGLVQAAHQFFIKFLSLLKSIGFTQSKVEPCLLTRKSYKGIMMMVIHVDDLFTSGQKDVIDKIV